MERKLTHQVLHGDLKVKFELGDQKLTILVMGDENCLWVQCRNESLPPDVKFAFPSIHDVFDLGNNPDNYTIDVENKTLNFKLLTTINGTTKERVVKMNLSPIPVFHSHQSHDKKIAQIQLNFQQLKKELHSKNEVIERLQQRVLEIQKRQGQKDLLFKQFLSNQESFLQAVNNLYKAKQTSEKENISVKFEDNERIQPKKKVHYDFQAQKRIHILQIRDKQAFEIKMNKIRCLKQAIDQPYFILLDKKMNKSHDKYIFSVKILKSKLGSIGIGIASINKQEQGEQQQKHILEYWGNKIDFKENGVSWPLQLDYKFEEGLIIKVEIDCVGGRIHWKTLKNRKKQQEESFPLEQFRFSEFAPCISFMNAEDCVEWADLSV